MTNAPNEHIEELSFANVIGDRFGRYSKYIIQDRALPDIRDGLKPVQRRILFAMYQERNTADNPYRKSAKTVGNVIGNYHPHGDSSVYDAMVRLSQDWKMGVTLVDMHGNKGSMDGDPAAAMRYTEARLSKIADVLLRDINHNTVDTALNFDDTLEEPIVLPARFPNLLVNGGTGISAGYATEIPPHNLTEVIDAVIYAIEHPDYQIKDLMKYIQGPDFPTGGIVQGKDDLRKAYEKGQGKVVLRSRTEIEKLKGGKSQIVATEIPFDVNKSKLIQRLDDIRLSRKLDGIAEVRDESDRDGVRVVVELKRDVDAEDVLNYLLKNSDLQVNYHFNMVAIHNNRPVLANLGLMVQAYIEHQHEVITRRTQSQLSHDQARLHIVDGLIRVVSILDEVIHTIRQSENKGNAKDNLVQEYDFTYEQAEAIVTLQLYRLTNTDIVELQNERLELNERIMMYENILNNPATLNKVLVNELKEVRKAHPQARRTTIEAEVEEITIDTTLLIAQENTIVSVTNEGYIKRTSRRSFQSSDTLDLGRREFDYAIFVQEMSTHDVMIVVTSMGRYLYIPVHELSDVRWKDMGMHLSQTYKLNAGESVIAAFPAAYDIEGNVVMANQQVVMATRDGMVKQTPLTDFETFRSYKTRGSMAIKLKKGDELLSVHVVNNDLGYELVLLTGRSYSLRYPLSEVSEYGLKAQGVKGINLKDEDVLVAAMVHAVDDSTQIVAVTQRGNIKRFPVDIVGEASRGSRGILILKELKAQPHRFTQALAVIDEETPFVVQGDTGHVVELVGGDVPLSQRLSNGSSVPELDKLGKILDIHFAQLRIVDQEGAESPEGPEGGEED